MSGECDPKRYEHTSFQKVMDEVLKLISDSEYGLTRCQIEDVLNRDSGILHGATAQALLTLVEQGKVEPHADYTRGWVTTWVLA